LDPIFRWSPGRIVGYSNMCPSPARDSVEVA
jgi:hypothetical protein